MVHGRVKTCGRIGINVMFGNFRHLAKVKFHFLGGLAEQLNKLRFNGLGCVRALHLGGGQRKIQVLAIICHEDTIPANYDNLINNGNPVERSPASR